MKKLLLLLCVLLTGVSEAWAQNQTATFSTAGGTDNGNYSTGWIAVVAPITGSFDSFTIKLGNGTGGTVSTSRSDAYLAISKNLKTETTGFSSSDFIAISSNTCGTELGDITMNFSSSVSVVGGTTYYFYFVTQSGNVYTTVNQRIRASNTGSMSTGWVGQTNASSGDGAYTAIYSCTMTIDDNLYYRLKGLYPDNICYIHSKSDNENKLWKQVDAPSVTDTRFVWKTTIGTGGVRIQNIGNNHYISPIQGDKKGTDVDYLSATNINDAEQFSLVSNRVTPKSIDQALVGHMALESVTNTGNYLNTSTDKNNNVGSYISQHNKSGQFWFQQVKKVDFSTAVAVNGGDAVSTIYVACDGSSASTLSLPSDNLYSLDSGETWLSNTDAAEIISAAGTSNISVTVAPAVSVTYNLIWDDPSTPIKTETSVNAPQGFSPSVTVPWNAPAFCDFSYDVSTIEESTTEVNVTMNWDGPFEFSTDYASAKWYYMTVNGGYLIYDEDAPYGFCSKEDALGEGSNAIWAFIGDPYNGVRVINKTAGNGKYLNLSSPVQMSEGTYPSYSLCGITENSTSETIGFSLDNDGNYLCYYVPTEGDPYLWYGQGAAWAATSKGRITVEPYIITYNLKFGGSTIATKTVDKVIGYSKDLLPSEWERDFCTYSYEPAEIGNSTTSVDVTMTWDGPFDISADYENAVWYYLAVNGKWSKQVAFLAPNIYDDISEVKGLDVGEWAFYGNPYDGFLLSPKAKYNTVQIYLSSAEETPAFTPATASTEKWVAKKISGSTFTLNCGDKYLVDNTTTMGFKTTALEGSEGTFSIRSYYCQKFIDDIYVWADANHRDEYFGPSETSLTTLTGNVATLMSNMSKTTYDGFTIPDDILSDIVLKYPTTGYYRIKNNGTGKYIAYGQPAAPYVEKTAGLIAISFENAVTDVSSIVKLTDSDGTYKLSTEGLNVQPQTTVSQAFPATKSEGVDFVFNIATPGIVSITNAASRVSDDQDGSLHHATGWTVDGIVNWSASSDNSKWILEDATSCTVNLNSDGAATPTYYATFCAPFSYTVSEGTKAYTLKKSGNWLIPKVIEGEVPAGTPVLLKGTTGNTATLTIGTGYAATPLTTTDLTGTYVAETINGGKDYVLGKKDGKVGFYHWSSNNLAANRAYLAAESVAQGARGFALMFEDDATGIVSTPGEIEEGTVIYNLSGQRLNKMQKGINIVNGKKVLF